MNPILLVIIIITFVISISINVIHWINFILISLHNSRLNTIEEDLDEILSKKRKKEDTIGYV
jgi:hypothetical protein